MDNILNDKKLIEKTIKEGVGLDCVKHVEHILASSNVNYSHRRNNDQHPNPPYFHHMVQIKELGLDRDDPFPMRNKLRTLKRKRDWDDVEDQRLGPLGDRIKEVLIFEKKPIEERIRLVPLIVESQVAMMNASPIKIKSPVRRGPYNPEKIAANRAVRQVGKDIVIAERKREALDERQKNTLARRKLKKYWEDTKHERELAEELRMKEVVEKKLQREAQEAQEKEIAQRKLSAKKKIPKCKNGTRRSKKTGNCEPK